MYSKWIPLNVLWCKQAILNDACFAAENKIRNTGREKKYEEWHKTYNEIHTKQNAQTTNSYAYDTILVEKFKRCFFSVCGWAHMPSSLWWRSFCFVLLSYEHYSSHFDSLLHFVRCKRPNIFHVVLFHMLVIAMNAFWSFKSIFRCPKVWSCNSRAHSPK